MITCEFKSVTFNQPNGLKERRLLLIVQRGMLAWGEVITLFARGLREKNSGIDKGKQGGGMYWKLLTISK